MTLHDYALRLGRFQLGTDPSTGLCRATLPTPCPQGVTCPDVVGFGTDAVKAIEAALTGEPAPLPPVPGMTRAPAVASGHRPLTPAEEEALHEGGLYSPGGARMS